MFLIFPLFGFGFAISIETWFYRFGISPLRKLIFRDKKLA